MRSNLMLIYTLICKSATLSMICIVTNVNCLAQESILIVKCGKVSPTLDFNPTLFVSPCKLFWGL